MLRVIPFFSPLAPEHLKAEVLNKIVDDTQLLLFPDDFKAPVPSHDFMIYFIGTGGTENSVAAFIVEREITGPIILISYDLNNSLPAAMETRTYLKARGHQVRIVHSSFEEVKDRIDQIELLLSVREKMGSVTMGLIGEPSDWLIASDIDRKMVSDYWGMDFTDIPISESTTGLDGQIDQDYFANATNSHVTELEVVKASSVAARLKTIVEQHQLQALSIKCFDLLSLTDSITACCGLSHLNDLGIIAGCEGDIPATVTMAFLTYLTNTAPFMANVIHVDEKHNHVNIAHCTVPTSIVEEYDLISHFETDKSVGVRGRFRTDVPVTICKLFGPSLTDYWASSGTLLRNISDESACRTQLEIKLDEPVEYFLRESHANHHIMVLGDYVSEINMFFELFAN